MKLKINFAMVFLAAVFAFGCTVNVNQPNANVNNTNSSASSNSAAKTHWSAVVCSSRAQTVTMSAGPNKNDSQVFAAWKQDAAQKKFNLPDRVQNLSSIFFMASASDKNQVEICVLYDGKPKKRVEFDDSEDHTINAGDADDSDCRCTQ